MKIELKTVCEQLTSALGLKKNYKVAACFKEPGSEELVGWIVVEQKPKTGEVIPQGEKFENLKDLFNFYKKEQNG